MTDVGGPDDIWKPAGDRSDDTGAAARALPPPWSPPRPEPPAGERRGGRGRRWAIIAGAVLGAALIGGAIGLLLVDREPNERRTDLAMIRRDEVLFDDVELAPGVVVSRTWRISDRKLDSNTTVENRTAVARWVVYDEIVPRPFERTLDADAIDGPGAAALNDSTARFTQELAPGRSMRVTYSAELAERPSLDDLEAWTEELNRAFRAHLADPNVSPVDGDLDGVPNALDACPTDTGTLEGCPDADGDEVADLDDQCEREPGPLRGCPDHDDDAVADHDDECPDDPGDVQGCPDADDDGFGEGLDDECVDEPGPVGGCPDRDDDGHADGEDQCATIPGDYVGCPDGRDVRWAIFNAFEHHIGRLTALPAIYDPDGDQLVEDGRGYCADVRDSFETLRAELDAAITGPPPEASADTVSLTQDASAAVAANISLLGPCLAQDVPFPWEDPATGWINGCALTDALVERVTGRPYECNSTW